MAQAGVVGLGRLTLSRRERMVMVEPSGTGMALSTLRAAGEVRAPRFGSAQGDLDAEMVAIAGAIIRQRTGNFDPSMFTDIGTRRRMTTRRRCAKCRRGWSGDRSRRNSQPRFESRFSAFCTTAQ